MVNCTNVALLRKMRKVMLVVTKEVYMRGVDYRCRDGIDMLICNEFEHDRAYE